MGSGGGYMPHGMPYQQGRPHQMSKFGNTQ